jgi:hypothetical protein
MPDTTSATANAVAYSAIAGNGNVHSNLSNVSMVTGYPKYKCLTTLTGLGFACLAPANANAIVVRQQATVSTIFARVFGVYSLPIATTATAAMRGSTTTPTNVAIIVDSTASMNTIDSDSNCSSTRINCAMTGVQALLKNLSPCGASLSSCGPAHGRNVANSVGRASLFTFPAVSTASLPNNFNCSGQAPTIVPYTTPFPSTSAYQIVDFSSDYRGSDKATSLSLNSDLVKALGGNSGCSGLQPIGGEGTFYAQVIYSAGTLLAAEQAANPGSQNVLIILSDGDANAKASAMPGASTTSGIYPSTLDECSQAVTAAQYVAAQGTKGTRVYSIAYGAKSSGCASDTTGSLAGITPCQTMQKIASAPEYFYSDYTATGGSGSCISASQPTTNLNQIFTNIAADLTVVRLIPNGTP